MSDLCQLVQSHMGDLQELNSLNLASGLEPLRKKLPPFINNRWRTKKNEFMIATNYNPPFRVFCQFLEATSDMLCADIPSDQIKPIEVFKTKPRTSFNTLQTNAISGNDKAFNCVLHQTNSHNILECDAFCKAEVSIRRLIAGSHKLCFKCLAPHFASDCDKNITCKYCNSTKHNSL